MPRKTKSVYISELPYEPMAADTSATSWTTRTPAPFDREQVRKAVDSLANRQRDVIERRYGFRGSQETLEAIGNELGCTRERVRQIQRNALANIKTNLTRS